MYEPMHQDDNYHSENRREQTLAIDFDGVIHRYSKGYEDGSIYDPPMFGAAEGISNLIDAGYKIVIHTSRTGEDNKIREWLRANRIRDDLEITNNKIHALLYVDDKAYRFNGWDLLVRHLLFDGAVSNLERYAIEQDEENPLDARTHLIDTANGEVMATGFSKNQVKFLKNAANHLEYMLSGFVQPHFSLVAVEGVLTSEQMDSLSTVAAAILDQRPVFVATRDMSAAEVEEVVVKIEEIYTRQDVK
jgi:hypothetical protein